ncbi:hypothetical protein [Streptomyces sp. 3N207]|uniref:hypothetical protein n=1 Tax=Streptomyces sp. 3N207 TaxID=3457417 RepID=UPI003FCFA43F
MVTRHNWSRWSRGRGRAGRAGAWTAALCVTAAALGMSAPGAWAAGKPRLYEMSEDAKKVTGTTSSADAPKLKPGLFTDRIKPGEEKYYALDLDAKSDVHVTATGVPEPGTKVTYEDGLTVTLQTTDGSNCDEGEADGDGDTAFPLSAYAARLVGDTAVEACRAKGPYLVHVVREEGDTSDPSSWPLELSVMKEPGLKGSIPAPPPGGEEETDDNNTRPAPPSGTPKSRKGGTGFNDARAIGDGVWKDRLRPGETRYFRVPVDWGRRLYARMEVPNAAREDETGSMFLPNGFRMNIYNPARRSLYDEDFQSYDGDGAKFDRYSNPVRYENRFLNGDTVTGTRFAGWYYVAVTASPDMVKPFPKGTPVTLRIGVEGRTKKGPEYAGDAKAAGFGVDDQDREMADKGLTEAQADDDSSLRLLGWVGVGAGAGLLFVLAVWLLVARRRAAPQPGGWPSQPPQPPYGGYPHN